MAFTGNKDVDRLILLKIDSDKELVEVCYLNKYFFKLCDDNFFYKRIMEKYPKSIEFKSHETWKRHYLSLLKYKDLMMKKYGFIFKDGNFQLYYGFLKEMRNDPIRKKLYEATIHHLNDYIDQEMQANANDPNLRGYWNIILYTSAKYNNLEMFVKALSYLKTYNTTEMTQAVIRGFGVIENDNEYENQKKILEIVEKTGIENEIAVMMAAEIGEIELAIHFIKKAKNRVSLALLLGGSLGGFYKIVEFAINEIKKKDIPEDKKIEALNEALFATIEGKSNKTVTQREDKRDYIKTIDILIQNGANAILEAHSSAVQNKEYEIAYHLNQYI